MYIKRYLKTAVRINFRTGPVARVSRTGEINFELSERQVAYSLEINFQD